MKKIAVLTIALVLMASLSAFASDVTLAGEFTYGGISDFSGVNPEAFGNAYVDITFKVDDINSVLFELAAAGDIPGVPPNLSAFRLTTDLGKALNLDPAGITLKMYSGWFGSGDKEYAAVGGYNNQWLTDPLSVVAHGGMLFDLGIKGLVNVVYGQEWNLAVTPNAKAGAYSVMGPVSWEAWYETDGGLPADGNIGAGLKAALGGVVGSGLTLDLGASFIYDLDDAIASDAAAKWGWGVGAKVGVGMITGYVGVNGTAADFLDGVGVAVNLAPLANVGLDAGVFLDTFANADTFNSADLSVYYKAGAGTVRLGYLVTPETPTAAVVTLNAPTAGNGGLYAKFDIDF